MAASNVFFKASEVSKHDLMIIIIIIINDMLLLVSSWSFLPLRGRESGHAELTVDECFIMLSLRPSTNLPSTNKPSVTNSDNVN